MCNSRYAAASFCSFSRVRKFVDLDPATPQGILQFHAVAVAAAAVGFDGMRSRECRRAQQAAAKTRAFFIGPIDETNGNWRTSVKFGSNPAQHFEAREFIQCTVKPPTVRNRVEMPADQQRLFGFARQRHPAVSGRVVVLLYGQFFHFCGKPLARFQPHVGPSDALRAVFVSGERAELLQFSDGAFWIQGSLEFSSEMSGFALQHLAAAALTDKFSVSHLYFAAHRYH